MAAKPGKQPEDHKPSLKDRLRAKRATTVTYHLAETDEARALLDEVTRLRQWHEMMKLPTSKRTPEEKQKAADDLAAAEDAFNASDEVLRIELRGLSPREWSDLNDAFTVPDLTDEEKAAGKESAPFDMDGFVAALLSASASEADMSPDEWAELMTSGQWSRQEINALRDAALEATNGQSPAAGIPKG